MWDVFVSHTWYIFHACVLVAGWKYFWSRIVARCYTGPPKKPGFNLTAKIFKSYFGLWVMPYIVAPTYTVPAALVPGDRMFGWLNPAGFVFVLFDKGVDIHWSRTGLGAGQDYIEIPANSGMVYQVRAVDSVGRGYPNEYLQVHVEHWPPFPDPLP